MSQQLSASRYLKVGARTELQPIIPLIEPKKDADEDKTKYIVMELKTKAGARGALAVTYKKYIPKFEEGTVQEWITFLEDIEEIYKQNAIDAVQDRIAVARTILQGESRACFDAAIEEQEGEMTEAKMKKALDALGDTIFPHRALEQQKRWMQRNMKKPINLTTRKMAAAITKINNMLPRFPQATEASKFDKEEIVELLELSLPNSWRQALDLKGFIPTNNSKADLIRECEAFERNEASEKTEAKEKKQKAKQNKKADVKQNKKPKKELKHCSKHGDNPSHSSAECWELHPELMPEGLKRKRGLLDSGGKPNKKNKKEINLVHLEDDKPNKLAKAKEQIAQLKAQLKKTLKANKGQANDDSDSEMSVEILEKEKIPKKVKKKVRKERKNEAEIIAEEQAFLKSVKQASASTTSESSASSEESGDSSE